MKKRSMSFADEIRHAVDASGMSRNQICREIGLDKGFMSHFMSRKVGLSLKKLDKLAEFLDLHVVKGNQQIQWPLKGKGK